MEKALHRWVDVFNEKLGNRYRDSWGSAFDYFPNTYKVHSKRVSEEQFSEMVTASHTTGRQLLSRSVQNLPQSATRRRPRQRSETRPTTTGVELLRPPSARCRHQRAVSEVNLPLNLSLVSNRPFTPFPLVNNRPRNPAEASTHLSRLQAAKSLLLAQVRATKVRPEIRKTP